MRMDPACHHDRRVSSRPADGRAPRCHARSGRSACRRRGCRRARAPVTCGPRSARNLGGEAIGLGEDRGPCLVHGELHRRPGRPGVPAAPELAGQDRRVDPAGLGPDADPGRRPASLNRIATSASSAWASRSMIPSECGGSVPVADRSASSRVEWITRPPSLRSSRSRTRPNNRSCACGLGSIEPARDVGQRRTGLDQGCRHGQRPCRRVGMREGRRVHDDAGHQRGARRPSPAVSGHAQPGARRVTISQAAAAAGSIQSVGPAP